MLLLLIIVVLLIIIVSNGSLIKLLEHLAKPAQIRPNPQALPSSFIRPRTSNVEGTSLPHEEELGVGASGRVVLGDWKGRPCAVKIFQTAEEAREEAERICEFAGHANVVRLIAREKERLYLEAVIGKTYADVEICDFANLLRLLKDATRAVAWIHWWNWVHCDIKPTNLLVDGQRSAPRGVLIDFCTAVKEHEPRKGLTIGWSAPEAQIGSPAMKAEDVWSLGATFVHVSRNVTIPTASRLNQLQVNMLSPDPGTRPTIDEVLNELNEIIREGGQCPHCGYFVPKEMQCIMPWCSKHSV